MEQHFEDLLKIRAHFLDFLEEYSLEELNFIPMGYRNHIFWNCAHALVTQQLLTYYLADCKMQISRNWVNRFKKGTIGAPDVTADDVKKLMELLPVTAERLKEDYFEGNLTSYQHYETSFGITLNSIEDAIRFNNIHEALHVGYIMALRKNLQ